MKLKFFPILIVLVATSFLPKQVFAGLQQQKLEIGEPFVFWEGNPLLDCHKYRVVLVKMDVNEATLILERPKKFWFFWVWNKVEEITLKQGEVMFLDDSNTLWPTVFLNNHDVYAFSKDFKKDDEPDRVCRRLIG